MATLLHPGRLSPARHVPANITRPEYVGKKSPVLGETEVKSLVVDDKWMAALEAVIHGETDRISQQLTQRVKELAERYETPLPDLNKRVAELEAKVNRHLAKMGFTTGFQA